MPKAYLDDVIASAQNVVNRTKSICVGLEPCVIPALGHSNFKIEDGTMEFGVGHHGEAGTKVEKLNRQVKWHRKWQKPF